MGKQWKTFFLPMTIVVVILIGVTYRISVLHGSRFWDTFYPQFFATVFGVIFTIMFTYAIWLRQQKVTKSFQRQQLLEDLKFEVAENLKRLENLETFLGVTAGQPKDTLRIRGLRTVAMKHVLKPENVMLLRNSDLEDDIAWIAGHCEDFNHDFNPRFRRFLAEVAANPEHNGPERAMADLRAEILPDLNFMRAILKGLGTKLEEQTTRSLDTSTS